MRRSVIARIIAAAMAAVVSALLTLGEAHAQRPQPEVVATIYGDTMYQVLPADRIPAISDPVFVTGEEASKHMWGNEPVMGLVSDGEAKAYSLWHLDAHEIVNDVIGDTPIGVAW
ncbi:MAG: DUF3179 domain-containing protein [Candidatus Zixiibacteriota bacterium]|nr:MAG: DUF3179 domain-containing protein [candidate division Zixibacteria bacterium]